MSHYSVPLTSWACLFLLAGALVVGPLAARGATVFVDPVDETPSEFSIAVGGRVDLPLVLELEAGEEASVFEGHFDLVESGAPAVTAVVLEADAPVGDPNCVTPSDPRSCTWESVSADIDGSVAVLSLFSENAGGERRLGTLEVRGLAQGTLDVVLLEETIVQRDVPGPPFVEDVDYGPEHGTVIARVVVPEPAASSLLGVALLAITVLRTRSAQGGFGHAARRP